MEMERPERGSRGPRASRGFSLVELIVVVGIIAVMSAIAIPAIGRYIRNYQIRGAADQVAAEIQQAKLIAVKKNVNYGVVFVVLSETTYQYFVEDKPLEGVRQQYDDSQQGTIRTLPAGVTFTPAAANVDEGFRFDRLGGMCNPTTAEPLRCPALADSNITPAPTDEFVTFVTGNANPMLNGAQIDFSQSTTGLTRKLVVSQGGRVTVLNR